MHVVFCHDTYYARSADETVYSYSPFPYKLWEERFLPHFEALTIIGREKTLNEGDKKGLDISSGPNVEHVLLPNINRGPKRILQGSVLFRKIKREVKKADAVIIRGPAELGMMAAKAARQLKKPYAIEMSNCAYDYNKYYGSLIDKLYAPLKYKSARKMVLDADAVIYATREFLQDRYPTEGFTEYASNVECDLPPEEHLKTRLKKMNSNKDKIILGFIGNFENNLKGLGVALEALSQAKEELGDFEFRILGQGNAEDWQTQIEQAGLQDNIVFSGAVPGGDAVLEWLDEIDIYLQPSFHEGLPRPLIEAMSRGCPAIASDAGGTAELLQPPFIHERGDARNLAAHVVQLTSDRMLRMQQSVRNYKKSAQYAKSALNKRRQKFWTQFAELVKEKA